MAAPSFWEARERARVLVDELSSLKNPTDAIRAFEKKAADMEEMIELASSDSDGASLLGEIALEIEELAVEVGSFELKALLSGEHDRSNAILSINAGAGGTESCDWAEMLLRMYGRWCERKGYGIVDYNLLPGEEAGIKSVTIGIKGDYAFGFLRAEKGVHRLVRISPFDSGKRRHTSFASVEVIPEIADDGEMEINEKDLRVDTFRSSGAGGQHVNVTDSAVRITHIPTGLVVTCQNERSQHKNKASAMKVLRARLYEMERTKKEEEIRKQYGEKMEIAWGSQIRSYVFHPYNMVKDHRTKVEVGNVRGVMDGDIDRFIDAYLRSTVKG